MSHAARLSIWSLIGVCCVVIYSGVRFSIRVGQESRKLYKVTRKLTTAG